MQGSFSDLHGIMKEIAEQKLLLESSFNHQQTVYRKEISLEMFLQTATNYLKLTQGVTIRKGCSGWGYNTPKK